MISSATMVDEMLLVDQPLEQGFSPSDTVGNSGEISVPSIATAAITQLLEGLPITFTTEPTPFYSIGSWAAGANRGQVLQDLALDGDLFSPWFDNTGILRFIRSFDPATQIPDFDLDSGSRVILDSIVETDDLLTAPNRFIVISNGAVTDQNTQVVIMGTYDVPSSAPHSIANRGFTVPSNAQSCRRHRTRVTTPTTSFTGKDRTGWNSPGRCH